MLFGYDVVPRPCHGRRKEASPLPLVKGRRVPFPAVEIFAVTSPYYDVAEGLSSPGQNIIRFEN